MKNNKLTKYNEDELLKQQDNKKKLLKKRQNNKKKLLKQQQKDANELLKQQVFIDHFKGFLKAVNDEIICGKRDKALMLGTYSFIYSITPTIKLYENLINPLINLAIKRNFNTFLQVKSAELIYTSLIGIISAYIDNFAEIEFTKKSAFTSESEGKGSLLNYGKFIFYNQIARSFKRWRIIYKIRVVGVIEGDSFKTIQAIRLLAGKYVASVKIDKYTYVASKNGSNLIVMINYFEGIKNFLDAYFDSLMIKPAYNASDRIFKLSKNLILTYIISREQITQINRAAAVGALSVVMFKNVLDYTINLRKLVGLTWSFEQYFSIYNLISTLTKNYFNDGNIIEKLNLSYSPSTYSYLFSLYNINYDIVFASIAGLVEGIITEIQDNDRNTTDINLFGISKFLNDRIEIKPDVLIKQWTFIYHEYELRYDKTASDIKTENIEDLIVYVPQKSKSIMEFLCYKACEHTGSANVKNFAKYSFVYYNTAKSFLLASIYRMNRVLGQHITKQIMNYHNYYYKYYDNPTANNLEYELRENLKDVKDRKLYESYNRQGKKLLKTVRRVLALDVRTKDIDKDIRQLEVSLKELRKLLLFSQNAKIIALRNISKDENIKDAVELLNGLNKHNRKLSEHKLNIEEGSFYQKTNELFSRIKELVLEDKHNKDKINKICEEIIKQKKNIISLSKSGISESEPIVSPGTATNLNIRRRIKASTKNMKNISASASIDIKGKERLL